MKKLIRVTLLATVLAALLCTGALAADGLPEKSGIYDVGQRVEVKNAELDRTSYTIDGASVDVFYPDAEQLKVVYGDATEAGKYYLLVVQKGDSATLPTQSDIYYIDQVTADGADGVSFEGVYPKAMETGAYQVRLFSNASDAGKPANDVIGSFKYYKTAGTGLTEDQIVNLTDDNKTYTPAEDGTLIVTSDKAYVVLTTEATLADKAAVTGDTTAEWTRVDATTVNGQTNTYAFDLSEVNSGTVVIALKGDANVNGDIDASDASNIAQYIGGSTSMLSGVRLKIADTNANNDIDASDASNIRQSMGGSTTAISW